MTQLGDSAGQLHRDHQTQTLRVNRQNVDIKNKQGIDISFIDIHYSVQVPIEQNSYFLMIFQKTKQKQILNGVSGIFKAGTVNAIMGASGAGKTTLLNILACRLNLNSKEKLQKLYANDFEYDFQKFKDFANYVMQKDILLETMTVRQTLDFACQLKLILTKQQKREKIDRLSKQLKLENVQIPKLEDQFRKVFQEVKEKGLQLLTN